MSMDILRGIVRRQIQTQLALGKKINDKQFLTSLEMLGTWLPPLQQDLIIVDPNPPLKPLKTLENLDQVHLKTTLSPFLS
jgi:hypothetical protein